MKCRSVLLTTILLVAAFAVAAQQKPADVRQLAPGQTVEREIAGGQTHSYRVTLQQGQFLRAVVDSHDIDVVATLYGPGGEKLLTVDLLKYPGPVPQSFVAEKAGDYRLEIRADAPATSNGHYELSSQLKAAAETLDLERLRAERLLAEANDLVHEGSKESQQKSIIRCTEALLLWRKLGDKYWEAYAVSSIGSAYSGLGEKQKALEFYNQALALERAVGDRRGEAATLDNLGGVYSVLGEPQKELGFYEQALVLERGAGDRRGEASTLAGVGSVYSHLGESDKALEFYNQALALKRAVGDRRGEASALVGIGLVYSHLGKPQKALEFYNQALALKRAVGDRRGEAATLYNIGAAYSDLGEQEKALEGIVRLTC